MRLPGPGLRAAVILPRSCVVLHPVIKNYHRKDKQLANRSMFHLHITHWLQCASPAGKYRAMAQSVHVHSLHCYPVKSLRGIDLPAAELLPEGLRHDRHWLIIDAHGNFLSQRHLPSMALVRTALDPGALTLESEGMEPLRVPFRADGGEAAPNRQLAPAVRGSKQRSRNAVMRLCQSTRLPWPREPWISSR